MNKDYEVKKTFIDKETHEKFEAGSCYVASSQERAAELERGGYIAPAESVQNAKANYQANQKAAEKTNVNETKAAQTKSTETKAAAKAKTKTDEV